MPSLERHIAFSHADSGGGRYKNIAFLESLTSETIGHVLPIPENQAFLQRPRDQVLADLGQAAGLSPDASMQISTFVQEHKMVNFESDEDGHPLVTGARAHAALCYILKHYYPEAVEKKAHASDWLNVVEGAKYLLDNYPESSRLLHNPIRKSNKKRKPQDENGQQKEVDGKGKHTVFERHKERVLGKIPTFSPEEQGMLRLWRREEIRHAVGEIRGRYTEKATMRKQLGYMHSEVVKEDLRRQIKEAIPQQHTVPEPVAHIAYFLHAAYSGRLSRVASMRDRQQDNQGAAEVKRHLVFCDMMLEVLERRDEQVHRKQFDSSLPLHMREKYNLYDLYENAKVMIDNELVKLAQANTVKK